MKRTVYALGLIFCLALGFYAGVVWAQGNMQLSSSTFSQAGTGAEPLQSEHFQARVSAGQPGPVGEAFSPHFHLHSGYVQASHAPAIHSYYLPLFRR